MPGHIDLNSLPTLKAQLAQGEEVLLTRDGRVVAKVVPVATAPEAPDRFTEMERMAALRRTALGMFADQIHITPDAFAPDSELEELFYADDPTPVLDAGAKL